MNIEKSRCNVYGAFLACIINILLNCLLYTAAVAGTPWWHNAALEWKPFTGFPTIENTNSFACSWKLEERTVGANPKLFAVYSLWNSEIHVLVSPLTNRPTFAEMPLELPESPRIYSFGYATTTAMCTWGKPFNELFIGSSSGIWRFDETTNQLSSVWFWGWDPTYIRTLGNAIYGSVLNWGSESGEHIWSPSGKVDISSGGGTAFIWADPVSGRYGEGSFIVRLISPSQSIVMADSTYGQSPNGRYSFDGGVTFYNPVGIRDDGQELLINNFYVYDKTNVIVHTRSMSGDDLFIGNLGGTLYPLHSPIKEIGTFFYSPSTRLLIVGDRLCNNVYSAILNEPDQLSPEVTIANAVIVSWPTQFSSAILQGAPTLTGTWQEVMAPRNVVGETLQVAIPTTLPQKYFRLLLP